MSSLLIIKGPNVGIRYELSDLTRIGRADDNEVQIPDSNVSRLHAEIVKQRMAYTVRDCGSRNGVLVNGQLVHEKLLLRNDEITIGNTVLLFNSELNIRNARFSDNSVYLYPAEHETIAVATRESQLERLTGAERDSIELITRFADLFSEAPGTVAATAEHIISHLLELLLGDNGVLLLRDEVTGDLRPVIALPAGHPARVNRHLVATVMQDAQPIMLTERRDLLPAIHEGPLSDPDAEPQIAEHELSLLAAPILAEGAPIGVLVVGKYEADFYSLRDLGLLQAVAKMASGLLQAAQANEQAIAAVPAEGEPGAVESQDAAVKAISKLARKAADSDVTILITGESGTGKEVLAREIHEMSKRRKGPFVALNCGAIPATLFESELFGYEKGAFTGAARTTAGKIEAAHGGTLFLDEIGELDLALQPKMLRFLQDHTFYRVGGTRALDANVRIIAATNRDLNEAVVAGDFREDLWYRINVVHFEMPPLRERIEDIQALLSHLIHKIAEKLGRRVSGANEAAVTLLKSYSWPGNIRELENAVERAVLLSPGKVLTAADFSQIERAIEVADANVTRARKVEVRPLAEIEKLTIIEALQAFGGNQAKAAEALGVHRNTLRNKIVEYNIQT